MGGSPDYFVVGSHLVLRSIDSSVPGEGPGSREAPLRLRIVHDDAGDAGTASATRSGQDLHLTVDWDHDGAAAVGGPDRTEAWRLFTRVCAKLLPEGGRVIASPGAGPGPGDAADALAALADDGFTREPDGTWVGDKAALRRRNTPKADSFDGVYTDPLLVPWNAERRPWLVLGRVLGERVVSTPGARVLDLGCGFGANAVALEERGVETWGIDVSSNAIRRCRGLVRHPERFHAASVDAMTVFDEASFHVALDIGCLHCLPEDRRRLAVGEIARVLVPEGVLHARVFLPQGREFLERQPWRVASLGMSEAEVRALMRPQLDVTDTWGEEEMTFVRAVKR